MPNKGDLADWEDGEDISARKLTAMTEGIRAVSPITGGKGVRVYTSPTGGTAIAMDAPPAPQKPGGILVKITGTASGGGKYTGVIWSPPTVNIPATGDLTEAEVGVTSSSVVRVVNTTEVGKSTHDLASTGYLPLIFPATLLKTADDGVPVYAIVGFQVYDCDTA